MTTTLTSPHCQSACAVDAIDNTATAISRISFSLPPPVFHLSPANKEHVLWQHIHLRSLIEDVEVIATPEAHGVDVFATDDAGVLTGGDATVLETVWFDHDDLIADARVAVAVELCVPLLQALKTKGIPNKRKKSIFLIKTKFVLGDC